MKRFAMIAVLLAAALTLGTHAAQAQVYYVSRPVVVGGGYPYYPGYYRPYTAYYGGWYPGSYMNNYGNYGAYHAMSPIWPGGYGYTYW